MAEETIGLVAFQTLGTALARELMTTAVEAAGQHGSIEKGFCVVAGIKDPDQPMATGGFGDFSRANWVIAHAKVQTALNTRRSTKEQAEHLVEDEVTADHYAGAIKTLFGGGVLLVNSTGVIVGAMAWSGGTPDEDIEICATAAERHGLHLWSEK